MTMKFEELTNAVGEWSQRNFGKKQNPYMGMVEELGELAHCLLKREQGIRGFENPGFFLDQYMDALGDICIYAANFAYNEKLKVDWPYQKLDGTSNDQIAYACFWLSQLQMLPELHEDMGRRLFCLLGCIRSLARQEELNLEEVAQQTWERVSVRDWKVNSQDGNVPA
jgi:hypothetical protein